MLTEEEKKAYEELKSKLGEDDKPTFDDLLKEPNYQAEFDKKVANAMAKNLEKEKAKWQKELEEKETEAKRLASLSAEEKHKEELDKAIADGNKARDELNAYKLKEEAQKIALEKGMDVSLLNIIDFSKETAETVKTKIDAINDSVTKAVEKTMGDKLKQPAPRYVDSSLGDDTKAYLDDKYKDNPYYKKG